ncbi:hypothetical protein M2164_001346 [Streptomyces sp. SAI-208]|jgi:hypothetical protein|uniref:hypothetical protein n=1 Tax=unclassified Streptomyces TaxID=2593676 RepID=UPI0024742B83|nr:MULTISPECIES: hypothetical protein [unclassified Streptomyces]MDH6514864.1 hypothetical protein [Streptomyces sp. SAI-090]MDH6547048.1 hypothetical protein [Streptomyces sp. SAI-041]MDH6588933.1 hypothetical protein [Streptomyces sp. SAI-133]MDH6605711.1 hypothetical protein [Streptomyces sp. SAI-208]MDH6621053.1 hypothetical protein [Streptomyces sp. SAI-135]
MSTLRAFHHLGTGSVVLALGLLATATVTGDTADATSTAVAPGRGGSPTSAVDRVADFYGAYVDVLYDSGHGQLSGALRAHYLTTGLQRALARWEAVHHMDGVLRAKGVPAQWSVVHNDSGMGHCWSRVTLTWQDGHRTHRTHLMIQSDLATGLISGIKTVK